MSSYSAMHDVISRNKWPVATEMCFYRTMLRLSWTLPVNNEDVSEKYKQKWIYIQIKRVEFSGPHNE